MSSLAEMVQAIDALSAALQGQLNQLLEESRQQSQLEELVARLPVTRRDRPTTINLIIVEVMRCP